MKLLATLSQLAVLANQHGHTLPDDASAVIPLWDANQRVPALNRIFALHALRVCAAHVPGAEREKKIADAISKFGIDVAGQAVGWGCAVDASYDQLAEDLNQLAQLFESL